MTEKTFTAFSRAEIKDKIDVFLVEDRPFRACNLIMPAAGGATLFEYRGMRVREWHAAGNVRFDALVELL